MSAFGEALAGAAAVASVSQLLAYLLQTSQALARFYNDMENAPSEIRRIQRKLLMLHGGLKFFKSSLSDLEDEAFVSLELRSLLESALQKVYNVLVEMQEKCLKKIEKAPHRFSSRFRFAWCDRITSVKLLGQLQEAENDLIWLTQLLNIRISVLSATSVERLGNSIHSSFATLNHATTFANGAPSHAPGNIKPNQIPSRKVVMASKNSPAGFVLSVESWLRKLGFYCTTICSTTVDEGQNVRIFIGYKPPLLVSHKTWSIYLHFLRSGCSGAIISILSGFIRPQNQVPLNSPFMKACAIGDTSLIAQYITEDREVLNNRTICSGKTPLLLAIESKNLDSIRYLLEAGADPNMGDDERMFLPIFAALGYRDMRAAAHPNRRFVQFAPNTTSWFDILQLLVRYGASVHEVMANKTMTTLRYSRECYEPEITVRYFQLLISECYVDFDVVDDRKGQCSALWNAIRSRQVATSAIDILADAGVQLGRIYSNGRNALHMAAEMAYDAEPLIHLYSRYDMTELNRQDKWGWSPLHYAIMSTSYQRKESRCAKVRFLLERGADPHLRGFREIRGDFHPSELLSEPVTALEYAATFRPRVYQRFMSDMKATGKWPLNENGDEEDVFFDSHEHTGFGSLHPQV